MTKFTRVVGFLQNAWSPYYAGRTWPRVAWLRALERSRSGQRLSVLVNGLPRHLDVLHFDNTTLQVGPTPSTRLEPDLQHMRRVLECYRPDVVLAFGKQADRACRQLVGHDTAQLILPHPAYRLLTNQLYCLAAKMLCQGFGGVCELRQLRQGIDLIEHDEGGRTITAIRRLGTCALEESHV